MGEQVDFDSLPEGLPTPEYFFKPVMLSGNALDKVSQIVPDHIWKPVGIYTWLERRANAAFLSAPAKVQEVRLGKLRYFFECKGDQPTLTTVILA